MLIYVYVLVVFFLWFLLFVVHLMIFLMNYFSSYYRLVSFDFFILNFFSVHTRVLCHCRCCWRTSTQVWKICQTAKKNNWNIVWFIVYTFYFAPLKPTTDSHSIQFNWIYICISISVLSLLYSIYMCVCPCVCCLTLSLLS